MYVCEVPHDTRIFLVRDLPLKNEWNKNFKPRLLKRTYNHIKLPTKNVWANLQNAKWNVNIVVRFVDTFGNDTAASQRITAGLYNSRDLNTYQIDFLADNVAVDVDMYLCDVT